MSHLKERKEKICLNCTATLHGRFCHNCGQENTEPKESFLHLATHFFNDLTHFDGKFFTTVKYLLFRPGFLAAEYARGKRASYLNPIRMYIFTSAVFFLIFSWHPGGNASEKEGIKIGSGTRAVLYRKAFYEAGKVAEKDSVRNEYKQYLQQKRDSLKLSKRKNDNDLNYEVDLGEVGLYTSVAEYDSLQKTLPEKDRDGWIGRAIQRKIIVVETKYKGDIDEILQHIIEGFFHNIPKGLIVGLPLLALLLSLLYVRKKEFYYVNHIIFIIDFTIATFLILMASKSLSWLAGKIHLPVVATWIGIIFTLSLYFYLYKALRRFYKQSRMKTILKYCLFLFGAFILFIFMMIILFLTSAWLV